VKKYFLFLFCSLLATPTFSQETTFRAPLLNQPVTTGNENYSPNTWNKILGSSELDINRSPAGESLMGNLVCDAMRTRTEADFAFISYGELYSDLYRGEITHLDMFRLIPFNRTLVVLEMSGDTLKQIIEKTLGGVRSGLVIAGGKVEYDPNRPARNRLTFVQVGDYPLYPKKEYRVVTIDYLADGFSGFDLLKEIDQAHVFRTGILLRDMLTDHIRQNSPFDQTKVTLDGRWIKK
jgi:2',3'-cyclic-nucleotide 2'-phosphodiesterase (5'-nucleotidase family)